MSSYTRLQDLLARLHEWSRLRSEIQLLKTDDSRFPALAEKFSQAEYSLNHAYNSFTQGEF